DRRPRAGGPRPPDLRGGAAWRPPAGAALRPDHRKATDGSL
ncbi:MAG: hypothetical protein AVDCRST_MAG19-2970, partial [uncultured Thermomicrobiales bacterium]